MDINNFLDQLAASTDLPRERAEYLSEVLCTYIVECVAENNVVSVPAFGNFECKKKMERVVVHPSTGKRMLIPPRLTMIFRGSSNLKNKINNAR